MTYKMRTLYATTAFTTFILLYSLSHIGHTRTKQSRDRLNHYGIKSSFDQTNSLVTYLRFILHESSIDNR